MDLQGSAITIEALRASLTNNDGDVDEAGVELARAFSRKLHLILSDTCKGEPYRMVESAGFGQGFEAWRILLRRYASKTPGTKRALLQALFKLKPANSVESFDELLLNLEEGVPHIRWHGGKPNARRYQVRHLGSTLSQRFERVLGHVLRGLCVLRPSRQSEHLDREETLRATQEPSAVGTKESPRTNAHGDWSGAMVTRRMGGPCITGFTGLGRVSRRKPSMLQVAREPTVEGNEFCAPGWKE